MDPIEFGILAVDEPALLSWSLLDLPDQLPVRTKTWECARLLKSRTTGCKVVAKLAVVRSGEAEGVVRKVIATAESEGLEEAEASCEAYRECLETQLLGVRGALPARFGEMGAWSTTYAVPGTDVAALDGRSRRDALLDGLHDLERDIARLEGSTDAADQHNLRVLRALQARYEWLREHSY
jgi:hypothetical protein